MKHKKLNTQIRKEEDHRWLRVMLFCIIFFSFVFVIMYSAKKIGL